MPLDKILSFKIDPHDAEKLELIAAARGTSVGAVIREAIQDGIYGPAWAMEVLQEIKENVESEYGGRFAILETAKAQVEEKIKTLTEDAENLTAKMAELLEKESRIDDPKEALEVRKQYKEFRDLLDITGERLEATKEKHTEILRGIAQLEKEKSQKLNEALRQAFPQVCEPLLEGIANRLMNVANALKPYLAAFASPATPEHVMGKFLRNKLGEMVRVQNELAYELLGKPSPLARSYYENWQSFWKFWRWQTGCKFPIEDEVAGDGEGSEEPREEAGFQAEGANDIKIEI